MASTLKNLDELWFEADFSFEAEKSYRVETDMYSYSFSCFTILKVDQEYIIAYGKFWLHDEQDCGWRILCINKIEKSGTAFFLEAPLSQKIIKNENILAILIPNVQLGRLPGKEYLYPIESL